MEYPNIKYFITSEEINDVYKDNEDDKKTRGLLLAKIKDNSEHEYDAIIVTPGKDDILSGNNLIFHEDGIIIDKIKHKFNEFCVGIESGNCYLIIEKDSKKIWHLPDQVIDFLEMYSKTNYCLTLIDNIPHVLNAEIRNTYNANMKIVWKKKLILRSVEGLTQVTDLPDINTSIVKFHLFESEDPQEKLMQSYFSIYNSEYFLKDCYVLKDDNRIGVYCNLKIDNQECNNSACLIGQVDL